MLHYYERQLKGEMTMLMLKNLLIGPLKWFVLAALLIVGLIYWTNWTVDTRTTISELNNTIERRDSTISELREAIADHTTSTKEIDDIFTDIEYTQVDLLCAARYGSHIVPQPEPTIIEVVRYRDRVTQCPTLVKEDAEYIIDTVSEYRPVNEEIALVSLDNSWKAYCAAVDGEDKLCAPFK